MTIDINNNKFNGNYDATRTNYSHATRVRAWAPRVVTTQETTKNYWVASLPGGTKCIQTPSGLNLCTVYHNAGTDTFYVTSPLFRRSSYRAVPTNAKRHPITDSRQMNVRNSEGRPSLIMLDTIINNKASVQLSLFGNA